MIDKIKRVNSPQDTNIRLSFVVLLLFFLTGLKATAQDVKPVLVCYDSIEVGAQQFSEYLPLLINKKVAVLVNQASRVNNVYFVDTLLSLKVNLIKIFSPEHGFRGDKDAGEYFIDGKDALSGLQVVSLYGKKKKPSAEDLKDVDILLIDLQDVGARFYTYISTMSLAMEACAERGVQVIVLDRPNPNGYFVDGPVLEKKFSSFVGMHPVPVVYGMTIGEYARMVNGEGWLKDAVHCDLKVVKMSGYQHNMIVRLKQAPSPNLPDWKSVYLYPSLCFFEGTIISVGRGTDIPFQVYGYPEPNFGSFGFTPRSIPGKSKYPKWKGKWCYGKRLTGFAENYSKNKPEINLSWLISAYHAVPDSVQFFNNYFEKLAGTDKLRKQIEQGKSAQSIRASWKPEINRFLKIRKRYLLYE